MKLLELTMDGYPPAKITFKITFNPRLISRIRPTSDQTNRTWLKMYGEDNYIVVEESYDEVKEKWENI